MKYLCVLFLGLFLWSCQSPSGSDTFRYQLDGPWLATLQLDSTGTLLPFRLQGVKGSDSIAILNATERLVLPYRQQQDTFIISLTPYSSEIVAVLSSDGLTGYWHNYAKGPDYKVPFAARQGEQTQVESPQSNLAERYEVWFGEGENKWPAIAEFKSNDKGVSGTFRTETGDYRYLEGALRKDGQLYLSCFDGAHAFLFTAQQDSSGTLTEGTFYSGNHYQTSWEAFPNDTFQLTDPDSLTALIEGINAADFTIYLPEGDTINLADSRLKNRVALLQIMGTWCPNCRDETEYLKKVQDSYAEQGIQILAFSFETDRNEESAKQRVADYRAQMNIPYPIYYAGFADKKLATDVFPMLDRVISYPTLIYLDRQGKVRKIHTGFNGPATSKYVSFVDQSNALIEKLLNE